METLEVLKGVYDLKITVRPADFSILENDGVLEDLKCENYYKHQIFGQEVATLHLEETYIDEVLEILVAKNIESDIETFAFFHGDDVVMNGYTRLRDGEMKCYSNLKLSENIALQMTKLLKQLDNACITEGREIIISNIEGFHSIGFIADPLLEPQA